MSTFFGIVFAVVLFVGGMYLFGAAFSMPEDVLKAHTFVAGIIAISLAIGIPAHLLSANERN